MQSKWSGLLQVCATMGAWIALFWLNSWVSGYLDSAGVVISWVFMPAAVRLLSVMLLGRRGAMGLWIGTLITNGAVYGGGMLESVAVATLSATGPLVAVYITMRWLKVPFNLRGLTTRQLSLFAVVGALCNAVPHNLFFWSVGITQNLFGGLVQMFVGDLLGIVIVLYTLRGVLVAAERFARFPTV